jgi:hypothetical protein
MVRAAHGSWDVISTAPASALFAAHVWTAVANRWFATADAARLHVTVWVTGAA